MFFSIIVPTYNPRPFLSRLLDSILENDCIDELEVIIADDVSTESFDDIVLKYSKFLQIRRWINPTHMGAPLGGRKYGTKIASGKWITFIDQDDVFVEHALDEVKNFIQDEGAANYLITDIYQINEEGECVESKQNRNLTHGKFYEKRFLETSHVDYQENLKYCEDINLSVTVACALNDLHLDPYYFEFFTYKWLLREDSLSNANGKGEYFYKSFPDYIRGTLGTYVDRFAKCNKDDHETAVFYNFNIISMLLHLYFYYQGMQYSKNECPPIPKIYYALVYQYVQEFLKCSGWSLQELIEITYDEMIDEYQRVRKIAFSQIPFIEIESFAEFMNKLEERSR